MDDFDLFVEQAEYISEAEFLKWSVDHPEEKIIIKKLCQGGAKLLTGPRGCGKTTLFKKAFYKIIKNPKDIALPIYVNFKSSLKLEPFYKSKTNAVFLFNQWLISKIYSGINDTLQIKFEDTKKETHIDFEKKIKISSLLEIGNEIETGDLDLNISNLSEDIKLILKLTSKSRCIIFLDDAAHAFSPDQQRDFFDFFRLIKSKEIAPKAAIYPGVTTYSSSFHVGHDAEEIDIWIKPENDQYLKFMFGILESRLSGEAFNKLKANLPLLKLICFSSFGIPRSLLNQIQSLFDESFNLVNFTSKKTLDIIDKNYTNTYQIFISLKDKLPIYSNFIDSGTEIYDNILNAVKSYNRDKDIKRQSVSIGIKKEIPNEISKVLKFFHYCGLLIPKGTISKGEKGIYEMYTIHFGALINRNVFLGQTAISIDNLSKAFESRNAHEYTRIVPENLIKKDDSRDKFALALPPCQTCGALRINAEAKFCLSCGSKLQIESIYTKLIKNDISKLPLTDTRIERIKSESNIQTIQDILLDSDNKELRKVERIGPFWAKKIYNYAVEYLG